MKADVKAQELIEKYIPATRQFSNEMGWQDDKETAVQCAIIAVDEILLNVSIANKTEYDFWQEVKQHLTNK